MSKENRATGKKRMTETVTIPKDTEMVYGDVKHDVNTTLRYLGADQSEFLETYYSKILASEVAGAPGKIYVVMPKEKVVTDVVAQGVRKEGGGVNVVPTRRGGVK
mmetsp:Transcript_118786/g.378894  ORF Transcript_118786/g.378894 Transcript_118786/m.378894 type:complete len:105 (+) Transcript_118786:166-480(+)